MKGLIHIPSLPDLKRAYDELQFKGEVQYENHFAIYSQWTRFDPRLAEIWVKAILSAWKRLNPVGLNRSLKDQPWPNAAGVLLQFAASAIPSKQKEIFK